MFLKKMKLFYRRAISEDWNIGFIENIDGLLACNQLEIKWMKQSYKKGWFADPFILNITDLNIYILVEEYQYLTQRGCISKLTIDRKTFELKEVKQILCLNTHLSFPAILRYNGEVYIYPENCINGRLIVYHYNPETDQVIPINIWCEEPLTDAVLYTKDDTFYLLSTQRPVQNGADLNVYVACGKSPSTWTFEYVQTIHLSDNSARSAGLPFSYANMVIRPAQNCNEGYGKGIVLQKINHTFSGIELSEMKRFYPTSKIWNDGLHTFNVCEKTVVVDGRRIKYPMLYKTNRFARNMCNYIKRCFICC